MSTGNKRAWDYAYGCNPLVAPLRVLVGNAAAGANTIILQTSNVQAADGTSFVPLSASQPTAFTIGSGANAETVAIANVTAVTVNADGTLSLTATFANAHSIGDLVASATYGLAEAVNSQHAAGGGLVSVDSTWKAAGGVTGTITAVKGWTNVTIYDGRGTSGATSYLPAGTPSANGGLYIASAVTLY